MLITPKIETTGMESAVIPVIAERTNTDSDAERPANSMLLTAGAASGSVELLC